jgi:hypothetical protein
MRDRNEKYKIDTKQLVGTPKQIGFARSVYSEYRAGSIYISGDCARALGLSASYWITCSKVNKFLTVAEFKASKVKKVNSATAASPVKVYQIDETSQKQIAELKEMVAKLKEENSSLIKELKELRPILLS